MRIEFGAGEPLLREWLNDGRSRGKARLLEELLREIGLSCGGESPNISSSEVEVLRDVLAPWVLNRNAGALLSWLDRFMPSWKDAALLLARLGRRKGGRRRLYLLLALTVANYTATTYSGGAYVGASIGEACKGLGAADIIGESMGVCNGEGEWTSNSAVMMKAGLCGSGLISMGSIPAGDEGKGGVVNTLSVPPS